MKEWPRMSVEDALAAYDADNLVQPEVADVLAAEVRRLRIELDWRQGDTDTERARRERDREQVADVVTAWRELLATNPDARTLGGELSHRVWDAIDALTGDPS